MGTVFKFKQFEVDQRDCAMKINTDGVLLGATVAFDCPKYILDIGSGTGVISLMLAQRYPNTFVEAVEIDEQAYLRTSSNFEQSPFASRLIVFHNSFENLQPDHAYDLIVSNPPFYTNSLHNPDVQKRLARHTDHDFFLNLVKFSFSNLTSSGSLQLILPVDLAVEVIDMARDIGLYLHRKVEIRSFVETLPFRCIIDLRKETIGDINLDSIIIYEQKGEYTSAYKTILSPFFLAY